jgi:glycosyltransferase involved in cell wall biosynthesis
MKYPKISIVTPSFNSEKFLEQTIMSILAQDYPNLEYIIIDGSSTDNSLEIIRKYEKHLHYFVSEPDNGMYHALQKGFVRSSGDLMAWINSDDMYHPGSFLTVAEIFSSLKQVHWLQGTNCYFDKEGKTVQASAPRQFSKYHFYSGDFKWIQQESTFWTRDLWNRSGGRINENLRYAGDFELWLRFFRQEPLFLVNTLIGGFRITGNSQLSVMHKKEYLEEANLILENIELSPEEKKRLKQISLMKKLMKTNLRSIGRLHHKLSELFELPSKIVYNPILQKFEMEK